MKRVFLAVIVSVCSLLMYMYVLAHRNRLLTHSVTLQPSKTITVFFISDIHRRRLPQRLINKLRNCSVDVVIVGGDVAEKGVPLKRIKRNMQLLASVGPLYYILGNNDREVGLENIMKIVKEVGGVTLIDDTAILPKHPTWGICGLQDSTNGRVNHDKAVASAQWAEHLILAVHNPSQFRKVEGRLQPELMLAGHTHGGQIRLGNWGLQDKGTFRMTATGAQLISNGYGTTMVPLRLGAKPECHVIKVHY